MWTQRLEAMRARVLDLTEPTFVALHAITGERPTPSFVDLPMLTLVVPAQGPALFLVLEQSSGSGMYSPKTAGGHAATAMALMTSGNVVRLLLERNPLRLGESPLSRLVGERLRSSSPTSSGRTGKAQPSLEARALPLFTRRVCVSLRAPSDHPSLSVSRASLHSLPT